MKHATTCLFLGALCVATAADASQAQQAQIRELSLQGSYALVDLSNGVEPTNQPGCIGNKWEYRVTDRNLIEALVEAAANRRTVQFKGDGTCANGAENLDWAYISYSNV